MISGLSYQVDYIDPATEAALIGEIDRQPWSTALSRRVQHYGYSYDYRHRKVERIGPLPRWTSPLAERLIAEGVVTTNQVIVNEYVGRQGISQHIDAPVFGLVVAVLSLGSARLMSFYCGQERSRLELLPRSLLVLRGSARNEWSHALAGRKGAPRRLSVTFRSVNWPPL